ncbi:MAG: sensor histidine kinase [Myxococcales bacterium]
MVSRIPPSDRTANERRLERIQREEVPLAVLAYLSLLVLFQISIWGQWAKMAEGLAAFASASAYNIYLFNRLSRRFGAAPMEWGRVAVNLGTGWLLCHLQGWGLAGCSFLIVLGGLQASANRPQARWHNLALALGAGAGAWLDGVPPLLGATVTAAILTAFWVSERSARIGTAALQQLDERHRELAAAHAELERVQGAAVAQEKLAGLGLLAAGIAHEINNPMTYVTSNVDMLLRDMRDEPVLSPALREYADDVLPATLDGIRRVNSIVADLRRFARGDVEDLVPYDLNAEIRTAARLTGSRFKDRVELTLSLGDLPEAIGRPRQIVQVLVNLVVNAAQAIEGRGHIEITSRGGAGEVAFSVRDSGSGMDEATRRQLFQPFFTTKRTGEGTGLGLALIYGIVASHGGRIEVESAPGQGSCFTVTLPRDPPQGLSANTPSPSGGFRIDPLIAHVAGR